MKLISALIGSLLFFHSQAQLSFLLVGTYDSPGSEGIYVYQFNSSDGTATERSHVKAFNSSFLAVSPDEKYVYAVSEKADSSGRSGKINSFSFNKKTGVLSFLNQQSSEGNNPCYVVTDKTGRWVIAANYTSGNLSVLRSSNGMLDQAVQVIQFEGSGPDTARQKSPHAHGIFFAKDNYHVYVTDLGTDRIMTYIHDKKTGRLIPSKLKYEQMQPGSGPRHLAVHPNGKYVYVAEELSSTITVLRDYGKADLDEIQSISALPLYYKGPAGGSADIHISPDGKFLYISNRGLSNTIGIYAIDAGTGMLTVVDHTNCLGERPRNFNFDPTGRFLLVANQASDEIVIFKRDIETGLLTDSGKRISVGKPVCIKWIKAD